jgi:ribosomal protein S18 acetylase RimI-like enzyme
VKIRPIHDDEADAVRRITLGVYLAEFGSLPDDYVAELSDVRGRAQEAVVLVAVADDDTVLGGITYVDRPGPLATIDRPDQAELRMLAVTPGAQGRGIGTALVQACIDQARADGKAEVTLHTADSMLAAQRLYERAGFRRRPERDLVVDGGVGDGGIQLLAYALELQAPSSCRPLGPGS